MTAPFSGKPIRDVYFSNEANDTIEVVYNEAGDGQPESWISFFVPADLDSYTMKALIDEGYDFEKIAVNTVARKRLESAMWATVFKRYAAEEIATVKADFARKLEDIQVSIPLAASDILAGVLEHNKDEEALFRAKLGVFEMPEVKNLKDRTLKQKIRTAKSFIQLFAALNEIIQ